MDTNKKKMDGELIFKQEVFSVVGAAMEVHNVLGAGFLEAVYQEAMQLELTQRNIPHIAQQPLRIAYKDKTLQKTYIADLVAFSAILIEIKALVRLSGTEESQLLNYLKATGLRVGLLLNFGNPKNLEWKRLVL
jgi:GxxExxY protein